MKYQLILVMFVLATISASAQKNNKSNTQAPVIVPEQTIVTHYEDSLAVLKNKLDSVQSVADSLWYEKQMLGRYYKLFTKPTFFHSVAQNSMSIDDNRSDEAQLIEDLLLNVYLQHPELVGMTETQVAQRNTTSLPSSPKTSKKDVKVPTVTDAPVSVIDDGSIEVAVQKPKMWTHSADFYLQIMQSFFSPNWYQGGDNNYSMLANVTLQANYNNLKGIKWDNKLEAKAGLQSNSNDKVHNIRFTDNLARLTSKFGLQAHKRWYYTIQGLASTQIGRGYKVNDPNLQSDFLAPLDVALSLGMDYMMDTKNKKIKGSINLSPLAANYRYVQFHELTGKYGIEGEDMHKLDFGSQFTLDMEWQLMKNMKWKSRFYAYTSYHRADIQWENTMVFNFSKYLSTNIFIYPRFDDNRQRDADYGYFQLKEYLSFGFSFNL